MKGAAIRRALTGGGGKFPEMEQNQTCVAQLELIRANLFGLGQNQFEFLVRLFYSASWGF